MIRGITFSEQAFYSADFAHFQDFFLNGNSGITQGCQVTHDDTTVTIGTGRFIVHGRMMCIEENEVVRASQGFSGGYNRIVYEIDLSKENTITEFRQGYIKILHTDSLTQEDLNSGGRTYQYPFCHFQWSGTVITDLVIDAATMVLPNIFGDVAANWEVVNKQFDTWFDRQMAATNAFITQKEGVITGMIQDLQEQGFQNASINRVITLEAARWDTSAKTYDFEGAYPADQYDIEVQPDYTCTLDQYNAYSDASLVGRIDRNIMTAKGDVPVIDIPVILRVTPKASVVAPNSDAVLETTSSASNYFMAVDGRTYNLGNVTDKTQDLEPGKYNFDIE